VGTQPFGGEGLSGTGPKAGGPSYLKRFFRSSIDYEVQDAGNSADSEQLRSLLTMPDALTVVEAAALDTFVHAQGLESYLDRVRPLQDMPGPTGEINQLSTHPRGRILCLGPSRESARRQAVMALAQGNTVAIVASGGNRTASQFSDAGLPVAGIDGCLSAEALMSVPGFDAVVSQADRETLREYRIALSAREGRLIPLICEENAAERLVLERHLCIDTTAAGGNASLIAAEE
jgi:RHH-type proline utilization regulon transcriptional repressor/proline dehydrogenase/delta 1-pyrroline-5-carboxylate dehydrogenase